MQTDDAAAEAPPPALEKGEGGFFFPKTEPAPAAAESSVDEGPRYTQAELQSLLHSIVTQAKESYQGERSRAELFLELPSREDYPDYYETVQEPISIGMIEGKVAREEYTTPEHFREDWAQLRENAYAYNDDGSLVRVDAEHFFNVSQLCCPFDCNFCDDDADYGLTIRVLLSRRLHSWCTPSCCSSRRCTSSPPSRSTPRRRARSRCRTSRRYRAAPSPAARSLSKPGCKFEIESPKCSSLGWMYQTELCSSDGSISD